MKKIEELSTEDLENLLKQRKKSEANRELKEKLKYEKHRDKMIEEIIDEAKVIEGMLSRFKRKVIAVMDEQAVKLSEYGKIRSNSKGGFSVYNTEGDMHIRRTLDSQPVWDERANKGVELIKEFLFDFVKKRDASSFELLLSFITKNKDGDLEYSRVLNMLQHEKLYDDPRWLEGLKLLKEGYHLYYKGFGYEFRTKVIGGKWQPIALTFSSK